MMRVLNNIEAIYIKGSLGADTTAQVSLGRVILGSSRQMWGAVAEEEQALAVEHCECPAGYTGLSCQLCAQGYFSTREDKQHGGPLCEPCNCNGHADTCHPQTGLCQSLTADLEVLDRILGPGTCDESAVSIDRSCCDRRVVEGRETIHDDGVYASADDFCHFNPQCCETKSVEPEDSGVSLSKSKFKSVNPSIYSL